MFTDSVNPYSFRWQLFVVRQTPYSIHSLTRSVIFHTCILLISYLDTRFTWIQLHLIFEDNSLLSSLRSLEFIIVLPSLNQFIIHSYLWPEGEIFNIHSRSAFWKQCSTSYRLASRLLARKRSNEMQRTRQSRPLARMCNHLSYFPLYSASASRNMLRDQVMKDETAKRPPSEIGGEQTRIWCGFLNHPVLLFPPFEVAKEEERFGELRRVSQFHNDPFRPIIWIFMWQSEKS